MTALRYCVWTHWKHLFLINNGQGEGELKQDHILYESITCFMYGCRSHGGGGEGGRHSTCGVMSLREREREKERKRERERERERESLMVAS